MEEELLGNLTGILFVDFIMNSYQTRKKTDKDIQEYNRYYSNQDKIYNSLVRRGFEPPSHKDTCSPDPLHSRAQVSRPASYQT